MKYSQILQLAKQRRQYLVFAYSMFLLYREAGGVKSWIQEKVSQNRVELFFILEGSMKIV